MTFYGLRRQANFLVRCTAKGASPTDPANKRRNHSMPKINVKLPHNLDPRDVIAKAGPAMEKMVNDFQGSGLQLTSSETRLEFSFRSMAFTIKGTAEALPTELLIDVDLPLAAMLFKDMAEAAIRKNVQRALDGKPADDVDEEDDDEE